MSGTWGYRDYPVTRAKADIQSGIFAKITWHDDETYPTREAAEEALGEVMYRNRCNGIFDTHAVMFRNIDEVAIDAPKPAYLTDAEDRLRNAKTAFLGYVQASAVATRKSKLVTCPKCESKVNKDYVKVAKDIYEHPGCGWIALPDDHDRCPVCGQDLRSATVIATTRRKRQAIEDAEEQLRQAREKWSRHLAKKAPTQWLVEVHRS